MSGIAWHTVLYNIRFWTKFRMTKLASHVRIDFFRTQKNTPDTIRTTREVYWPCVACPHLASHVRIDFFRTQKNTPDTIRTCDAFLRTEALYPAELQRHFIYILFYYLYAQLALLQTSCWGFACAHLVSYRGILFIFYFIVSTQITQ